VNFTTFPDRCWRAVVGWQGSLCLEFPWFLRVDRYATMKNPTATRTGRKSEGEKWESLDF
jgi:hypothetical protein